jgi:hypothetical protein
MLLLTGGPITEEGSRTFSKPNCEKQLSFLFLLLPTQASGDTTALTRELFYDGMARLFFSDI